MRNFWSKTLILFSEEKPYSIKPDSRHSDSILRIASRTISNKLYRSNLILLFPAPVLMEKKSFNAANKTTNKCAIILSPAGIDFVELAIHGSSFV